MPVAMVGCPSGFDQAASVASWWPIRPRGQRARESRQTPELVRRRLLLLPQVTSGKALIHEKLLSPIVAELDWGKQREMWAGVKRV
ncbi:MAG: hypothetical protein GXX96_11270 [Planctomycetaceae bacterium]|nr:hypothetical protein [Planctomycetaceae bacterium]